MIHVCQLRGHFHVRVLGIASVPHTGILQEAHCSPTLDCEHARRLPVDCEKPVRHPSTPHDACHPMLPRVTAPHEPALSRTISLLWQYSSTCPQLEDRWISTTQVGCTIVTDSRGSDLKHTQSSLMTLHQCFLLILGRTNRSVARVKHREPAGNPNAAASCTRDHASVRRHCVDSLPPK